jgi:sensitive to high expression protein 9
MDEFPTKMFASINQVTGLVKVEELKYKVKMEHNDLLVAREELNVKKTALSVAIENRASCQSEINTLLHRKSQWTPVGINLLLT